jgi:8-oxo-dGTP diphosphatase
MGNQRPKIGVAAIITRDGKKVLLGKRKNSHGEGTWCFPGGHLEMNESIEECAARETMEEAGVSIRNIRKAAFTNDLFVKEKKHYVTLFVLADFASGEPKVMEPDKCEKWGWFSWENLPKPLFLPIANLLKQGFDPFKPSQ